MDDLAILAQAKYFSRQDHLIFLAIGVVLLLGYLAAVVGLWFLVVRHLPRRAANIGLGIALFLHVASAAIAMVRLLLQFGDGGFDPGHVLVGSLDYSFWKWLWLTLPLIVLSLIRLRRD